MLFLVLFQLGYTLSCFLAGVIITTLFAFGKRIFKENKKLQRKDSLSAIRNKRQRDILVFRIQCLLPFDDFQGFFAKVEPLSTRPI